jgi:hypothetical protein
MKIYGNNGQTDLSMVKRPISQDQASFAQRLADSPLKPSKPQLPADVGLFGDESSQLDLIEMFMD